MIKVRVYGALRDLVGKPYIEVAADSIRLRELFANIKLVDGRSLADFIADGDDIKHPYRVFVNGRLLESRGGLSKVVVDGDEVVLTPPVSAGGMVDISGKDVVYREAVARGRIRLRKGTIELIRRGGVEKGDVFEAAKLTCINAVKNTPNLLPYCHPIRITHVDFDMEIYDEYIDVVVGVKAFERTGVEMEALTGVSAALLTIWDMVKKYEKDGEGNYPYTSIESITVVKKIKREV